MAGVSLPGNWTLPANFSYVQTGKIMNADNENIVLAIVNDTIVIKTEVVKNDVRQQWVIRKDDNSEYFRIQNSATEKFLSAVSEDNLTMEGM